MAEPTEAEQKKQTDLLVGLDARGSNQETQLQKLASIIKEGNAYSVMAHEESMGQENDLMELEAMRESILRKHGKVQEKTLAAIEKQTAEDEKKKTEDKGTEDKKEQGEKTRFERLGNWFDELKKNAEDKNFFDNQKFKYEGGFFTRQLKWMKVIKLRGDEADAHEEHMEKLGEESNRFQRMSYNMAVRAAKLALRPAKAIKDWGVKGLTNMKDKAFDWIKSLGKLLVLLGIWGAALWLDANMLKEDWEKLKEKLTAWKDKLIAWWGELDGVLDTVMEWWNKIKTWFEDTFGVELKLWHVALAAFGLWMFVPKLAFMATFALAKAAFWGMKKLWQKFVWGADDLPKTKDIDDTKKKSKKGARKKVSWWRRMLGLGVEQSNFYDEMGKKALGVETKQPSMMDKVRKSFSNFGKRMSDLFGKTIPDKLGSIGASIKETTSGWMKSATDSVKAGWTKVKDVGGKIGTSIMDGIKGLGSKISNAGSALKEVVTKSPALNKIGNVLKGAGKLGLKAFSKFAVPFEGIRGAFAGFAERGDDDKRTISDKMDDASRGMVKGVTDFLVGDMLSLGGWIEEGIRTDLKEGQEGWLSGIAKKFNKWSDENIGEWEEGTKMMEGGGLTGLRMKTPQKELDRRKKRDERQAQLFQAEKYGLTTRTGQSVKSKGFMAFDEGNFQQLLLGASKEKSFQMLQTMVAGLAKVGQISAEDAARYKMDIAKEQAAGTPPIVINNSPTTNNSGSTSMIAASSANDPMKEVLKDW